MFKWIAIFLGLLLAFGIYSYVSQEQEVILAQTEAPTEAQVGKGTFRSALDASGKLRYLTTDWESLELATKEVKLGEFCYGDEVSFNNQNFNWKVVHFNSPTKVYVKWGACTTEAYTFEQIKVFLQARYPNREGNWEGVVEAP
jgi:hypothetical protein